MSFSGWKQVDGKKLLQKSCIVKWLYPFLCFVLPLKELEEWLVNSENGSIQEAGEFTHNLKIVLFSAHPYFLLWAAQKKKQNSAA